MSNQRNVLASSALVSVAASAALMLGCSASLPNRPAEAVALSLPSRGPDPVSRWSEVAADTINGAGTAAVTPQEKLPHYALDMATTHIAVYDALIAIGGTHQPFATAPTTTAAGASTDAAAAAAAYGVLKALFPNRGALYQSAYDTSLAAIPDGDAKTRGIAIGAEAASGIVALRANDGRDVVLAPYVPGTLPGRFRGTDPVNRNLPHVKPFTLQSPAQFRAEGPPALGSRAYTDDVNETRSLGSSSSTTRTEVQTDTARFHTEQPQLFWTRNLRIFATSRATAVDNARLTAMLWVAHADALIGCFESKYHFQFWRPASAITLADADDNDATTADLAWMPVVPTPNHPEYPAAHGCMAGAAAEVLRGFFGTKRLAFAFDSKVVGLVNGTRRYDSTDAMVEELQVARIWGGMHFRTSTVDGTVLGTKTAAWVMKQAFQPK